MIHRTGRLLVLAGLMAVGSPVSFADSVSLDVAPGLWHIATSGTASGVPELPASAMAKMSPQERAMAEAMLAIVIAQASAPHDLRICVTAEQVRQGFDLNRIGHKDCLHQVRSSTGRHLEMHVACTGKEQLDGTVRLDAISRTALTGAVDVQASVGTNSLTIRQSVRGSWLGADCAGVAPLG